MTMLKGLGAIPSDIWLRTHFNQVDRCWHPKLERIPAKYRLIAPKDSQNQNEDHVIRHDCP